MRRIVPVLLSMACVYSLAAFPSFNLEDQYRAAVTPDTLFTGKPLVLIGGDVRKTAEGIRAWFDKLKPLLGGRAAIWAIANLDGVPFFVSNNSVRNSLKESLPGIRVICDWDAKAYPAFAFPKGQVSVQVYSADRKLVGTVTGEANGENAGRVGALVR